MEIVFWTSLAVIAYVYVGYPLLLISGLLGRRKRFDKMEMLPAISIIIPAHNEELNIDRKLQNLLSMDYPRELVEILVGSDGCTDRTDGIVRQYADQGICLSASSCQLGKSRTQNQLVMRSSGSILVFTDADCLFTPDAVRRMVQNFSDPKVGLVTSLPGYENSGETYVTQNESLYLRYENWIRWQESDRGLLAAATGSLFALRRSLWKPLDPSLGDDFVLPLEVALRGFQNVFEAHARVTTTLTQSHFRSMIRLKTRIISKDLRGLVVNKKALNPWCTGAVAIGLWSHKVLRWLIPYFLVGLLVSSVWLMHYEPFRMVLDLQAVFYSVALAGALCGNRNIPSPWSVPLSFCLVNFAALMGTLHCASGRTIGHWKPVR